MQKHNASLLDILRGSIIIPGELLSSRAHFRLMNSEAKLNRNLYIYNLSKIREGYATVALYNPSAAIAVRNIDLNFIFFCFFVLNIIVDFRINRCFLKWYFVSLFFG
jgi:hypothetical protein